MRNILKMPTTHPFIEVTHYAFIGDETVFFYQGCEPQEDNTTKYIAGWCARIGENEHGDHVTLVDGLSAAPEAYEILFDSAASMIKDLAYERE